MKPLDHHPQPTAARLINLVLSHWLLLQSIYLSHLIQPQSSTLSCNQMKTFNPANDHIQASQAFGHCSHRGSEERSAPTAGRVCLGLLKVTRPRKGRAERRTREKYANQEKEKKQPTNQQASEQKRLTATTNELTRDAGASRYRSSPRSTSRSVRWSSPITKGVYRASFHNNNNNNKKWTTKTKCKITNKQNKQQHKLQKP